MDRKAFDRASGSLDERLSQALAKLSLVGRTALGSFARNKGISPLQTLILEHSVRTQEASIGQLARILGVKAPTVSDAVSSLVSKGLVRRCQEKGSRRILVKPTATGKRLLQDSVPWEKIFQKALSDCSAEEKQVLLHLLLRLIAELVCQGIIAQARICPTCRYFVPFAHQDPETPHHCALVDLPLSDKHLRADCPDHEVSSRHEIKERLKLFQKSA